MSFPVKGEDANAMFDDDGRPKRNGTLVTATAHIITTVIGSGVLSLSWAVAQLGWIAGPIAILLFSLITWFTSLLLADCYRSPHPVTGQRNYHYMDVVKTTLGGIKIKLCGVAQYGLLVGATIGYTIITSISMAAIKRSDCFHKHGVREGCHTSNNGFMLIFGMFEIVLSQIPNFHKLTFLSLIAAVMSFAYSFIGIGLSLAKLIAGNGHVEKSLIGVPVGSGGLTREDKMWNIFSGLGDISFAYAFSIVLTNIQDTLKSSPPENEVMKKASSIAIIITTMLYMLCGLTGYAAFGNKAPGNMLTGFGFFEPFWLVDFANFCIIIHLIGAYQVLCQPLFALVENWSHKKWPGSKFITSKYATKLPFLGSFKFNLFRLVWRTLYVIFTVVFAMLFPFFNDFVGLLGAIVFWPLTVYFPIEMYIAQRKISRFSLAWNCMQTLSSFCLIVSLLAAAGSIRGLFKSVQAFKLFHSVS